MGISAIWVLLSIAAHALSNASNDFAHSFIFGEKQPHGVMRYVDNLLDCRIQFLCF